MTKKRKRNGGPLFRKGVQRSLGEDEDWAYFFSFFKVVLDEVAAAERTKMEREKKRTERRGVL